VGIQRPGIAKTQGKAERAILSAKVSFRKLLIDKPKHWRDSTPGTNVF
jgi:hypothetical protein